MTSPQDSRTAQIGSLVTHCLDRCRASGYTITTLIRFLDEARARGVPEVDVQRVDSVMRHIMAELLLPDQSTADLLSESPTVFNAGDTDKPKKPPV